MGEQNGSVQPSTAEVLAEVERRRAEAQGLMGEERRRTVIIVDRFVFWLSKHWLAVFNTIALLYVGLPVLAPILMRFGAVGLALVIYSLYKPLCHQLPQRSFFLFGPQPAYTLTELLEQVGVDTISNPWSGEFVGNGAVGYKIALCQRDVAIYGMILLGGLTYGLMRRRPRPLPWWAYMSFGLGPMAIDGGYQWISNAANILYPGFPIAPYESAPLMRAITGALFGLATVWLAYPYVQEAMDEFRETLQKRFGWE
jgi:uncharacterized membrane protein